MTETPRLIFWETTKRCNLSCGYCRVLKNGSYAELTTGEALKLVSDIKESFPDTLFILSGGEPLLRKDLFEILSHASSIGLNMSIATNGTLLTGKDASRFRELGVRRVSVSIDSSDEARHDTSRGMRGAYKKALQAASILKAEGMPFQINFTVTKHNKDEIRTIAKLAHSLGAAAAHYFVVVATGCGRELDKNEMLDSEDMDEVLRGVNKLSREFSMEIRPTCAPQYVRFTPGGHSGGCLAGSRVFFISSEGYVYPCGYLPVEAGSIREEAVDSIWKNSQVFISLRQNDLKGSCSACSLKSRCRGCRARAYSATGDYMAGDATCKMSNDK